MTCLPEGGGCERSMTDVLVSVINERDGTEFAHVACLDVIISDRPQPEALYRDEHTGKALVIEHKSVMWPSDYAHMHKHEHALSRALYTQLDATLQDGRRYELTFLGPFRGTREDVARLTAEVVHHVRENVALLDDSNFFFTQEGANRWRFELQDDGDDDDDRPGALHINVAMRPTHNISVEGHAHVSSSLATIYAACARKFSEYATARRILVLSPNGDLIWRSAEEWQRTIAALPPPACVD